MIRLLIVDDSPLMRRLLSDIFGHEADFDVRVARDGLEAIAAVHAFRPHVVTLDVHMPNMDGLACLDRIMLERPCPVVMLSALTREGADETMTALSLGAVDFVPKPAGAVSLQMDAFAPVLLDAVRNAAKTRVRSAHRLAERVRLRAIPRPASRPPRALHSRPALGKSAGFPGLVLVGCSTGGPPALDSLLAPLPEDFPCPILVAQHMPAGFTAALARRLDGLCTMEVVEVDRPVLLQPGVVYIGRGSADVIVGSRPDGLIAMSAPADPDLPWHPSVDRLVDSARSHVEAERLIGVLMTGMGNDGARSMGALHAAGGHTIAEAEETAVVWGMPGALARAGGASELVPLGRIAARLVERVESNSMRATDAPDTTR